jgi:hypothetical protein
MSYDNGYINHLTPGRVAMGCPVIEVSSFFFFNEDPIYLQAVVIHSANGGEVWRMACRRVLSSTPL